VEPIGQVRRDRSSRDAEIAGSRHARGARVVGSFPAKALFTNKMDTQEEADAFTNYIRHMENR
jgi:hypothetical protein